MLHLYSQHTYIHTGLPIYIMQVGKSALVRRFVEDTFDTSMYV